MRRYARPCISDNPGRAGSEQGVQITVQGISGQLGNARSFLLKNGRAVPRSNNTSEWNDQKTRRASQMPVWHARANDGTPVHVRRPVNDLSHHTS
ncbi:hypothetical protein Hanom_Chr00s012174g01748721 [Helianthus anomalus]